MDLCYKKELIVSKWPSYKGKLAFDKEEKIVEEKKKIDYIILFIS